MKTWTDWAGSAALPYLLRAHKGPRALLIHAGAEADAILDAAARALLWPGVRALESGDAFEARQAGADFARALDLLPFNKCAAVAVPWTPFRTGARQTPRSAPKPSRSIHDALERVLRSTRSAAQPVLVRVDAAALPSNGAGVEAVAAALPDFTQARVILSAAAAGQGRPAALAAFPLPRDPADARRALPLLLGAARLASEAPAAIFHVQILVPAQLPLLAVRDEPFPRAEIVDPAAPAAPAPGEDPRAGSPQNAQGRARGSRTGNPAPGRADAPQGPSPRPQSAAAARRLSAPALAAPSATNGRGARRG